MKVSHRERLPDVPIGAPSIERRIESTSADDGRHTRGQYALASITGTAGENAVAQLRDIAPDLADWVVDFAYGDVMSRPGLDRRSRQIASVAALTAMGTALPQLRVHIEGALNAGCKPQEVVEVILQMTVFAGFPAAINALNVAREVFREHGA